MPSGRLWAVNASKAMAASGIDLSGDPATVNAPVLERQVVGAGLELVSGDLLGLVDDAVAGHGDGHATDGERSRSVGVHAQRGDGRVGVQHVDVVGADPEPLGDDHRPRRLVALAVRRTARDHLHLGRRQDAHRGRLPTSCRVVERCQHPRGSEPAHLEVRRHADAEALRGPLDVLRLLAPAQVVVADQRCRLVGRRRMITGVVHEVRSTPCTGTKPSGCSCAGAARGGRCRSWRRGSPSPARWRTSLPAGRRRDRRRSASSS